MIFNLLLLNVTTVIYEFVSNKKYISTDFILIT